jgi:hypothetical protein
MIGRLSILALLFAAACSSEPGGPAAASSSAAPAPAALPMTDLPAIDTDRMLHDIRALSSDEFEGRLPGSKGETLTVNYLIDQFKAMLEAAAARRIRRQEGRRQA